MTLKIRHMQIDFTVTFATTKIIMVMYSLHTSVAYAVGRRTVYFIVLEASTEKLLLLQLLFNIGLPVIVPGVMHFPCT